MGYLEEALQEARSRLPGWAYAVISKALTEDLGDEEPIAKADSMADLCKWAASRLPLELEAAGEVRRAESLAQLRSSARWAFDHGSDLIAKGMDGALLGITKSAYGEVAGVVPSAGARRPVVAFVGTNPSPTDAARGEPLTGPDGKLFADLYLTPLGLTREDVMVTNLLPVAGELSAAELLQWVGWAKAELRDAQPAVVVALGKVAKDELGELAHYMMPHPAAVRRQGDKGEVGRKVKQIRERLDILKSDQRPVSIAKAEDESRIIVGVVLDPYVVDTQKDWAPPAEIQKTAHDYVASSRVIGIQHKARAQATMVESFMWPYPSTEDYQKAMRNEPHSAYAQKFGNQLVHSGSWVMATRIDDDATWAAIKKGDITGYSIGGSGVRTPITLAQMPEVTFVKA